ncbi:MAG TPA: transcription-repair coupling factor [bacterium]|nr:transcription-repair coupling factor [bacterium]
MASDLQKIDWPQGEAALAALQKGRGLTLLQGLSGSAKGFFLAWAYARLAEEKPWVLLTSTREEADILRDDLSSWLPEARVALCPAWEVLPRDVEEPDAELIGERQRAFYQLMQNEKGLVIAPLLGALQNTLPPDEWIEKVIILKKDADIPPDFKQKLVAMGYEAVNQVSRAGQFAMRGGILDLASPGSPSGPVRLELFGDTLTSVRPLNLLNQRSTGEMDEVWVFPAREIVLESPVAKKLERALREKAREESRWAQTAQELFAATGRFPSWPWHALGAFDKRGSLFDYLPGECRILLVEPQALERKAEDLAAQLQACARQAAEEGSDLYPVDAMFAPLDPWVKALQKGRAQALGQLEQRLFGQDAQQSLKVESRGLPPYYGKFASFTADLKRWLAEDYQVTLWCHNKGEQGRLTELLQEAGFTPKGDPRLSLRLGEIEQSFALDEVKRVVVADHDLFRRYRGGRRRARRSIAGGKPLGSLSELGLGDWAVHVDSGICLYRGLTPLTIDGVTREYIQLEFADSEKIYLPTDQIALVQRYIGAEGSPVLSKLGNDTWSRTKAKVRREIEAVARELMALYAARQSMKKKPVSPDTPWQHEFEDAFLYELTPGQYGAVRDVKKDMESDKPMDRLVCGDVGYGKTEVAMRAAFKAVQDKKQVALLVPTTILAQQHFNTFKERMAEYPVNIQMLSRFRKPSEVKKTLEEARDGKADIVIGTHRLLGKDVKFNRLGLLIIDEEHRFGVAQKEKLKALKTDVDVLTLTATPIPRTLHLSLSGIREISIIDTPPQNRLSVSAHVGPMDDKLVAEAIRREMNREGQVFYVHNHVRDIERIADHLHKLVPEAKLAVAHGQLTEHELESIMMDFVDREYDVLVCTSIIESGLDMPNVNTLIVERTDLFGLSQLHQLKGRVGRTNRQAYAYFFYPRHLTLRELAQKRLEVLQEFSSLGSGMHIAMKDMEIRGAGNVLGTQQHGTLDSIGFDLYSRMLSQELAQAKGEEAPLDFTPALSLGLSAYLPKDYIPEEAVKIEFYRRLVEAKDEAGLRDIQAELEDRFGQLPPEAATLMRVAALRPAVKAQGIQRLEAQGGWVFLQWHPDLAPSPEKVQKWMKQWPPTRIRFSAQDAHSISFRVSKGEEGPEGRLQSVQKLLLDIASA